MRRALTAVAVAGLASRAAHAHHGVASVGFADGDGPGVGLETTAAVTLPRYLVFAMAKSEFVSFPLRADRASFPEQKALAWFNTAALGFGIAPSLSAYVFQPYSLKSLDGGYGHNTGLGDTNLMLAFGWKWDEGPRLIPQKESLDELRDWHFLVWASCTLPVGSTEHVAANGQPYPPDIQTGFGTPSPAFGLAALKQVSPDFTVLAEVNYQHFFPHDYRFVRYRFGGETRASTAVVYRLYGKRGVRLDIIGEGGGVHLQRDREDPDGNGAAPMAALSASGGDVLYGGLGLRAYLGRVGLVLGIKRALAKRLNQASQQQGSEGLENFRLAFAVSGAAQF